jgi:hypothetical protein
MVNFYSEAHDTARLRHRNASLHALQRQIGFKDLLRKIGHVTWLRYGIRHRIVNAFYSAEYSTSEPFEIDF